MKLKKILWPGPHMDRPVQRDCDDLNYETWDEQMFMMYFFAAPVLVALGNPILIYFSREIMIRFLEE